MQQSGLYKVITSFSGSNCYYSSIPQTLLICKDKIKPNIKKSGNVLSTDSLKYPLQWYIDGKIDSSQTTAVDSASVTGNYWVQAYDSVSGCVVNSDTLYLNVIGINELNAEERLLTVFPNPTAGEFYLHVTVKGLEQGQIKIESLTGQLLLNEYINCKYGCDPKLDVSNLSSGVYLLKFLDDENLITRKIVIQK